MATQPVVPVGFHPERRVSLAQRRWSNATIFLVTEPPWSVTAAWMSSYLTIYLTANHASVRAVGLALGLAGLVQVAALGAMGGISLRLGRKAVVQIGDFFGWLVSLALWVVYPSATLVLVAYVLNQASMVVTPAWNSLFSDGIDRRQLSRAYVILQVMTVLGGMAVPLSAIGIGAVGVARFGRWILAASLPLIAASWAIRQRYLTDVSQALQTDRSRSPLDQTWAVWGRLRPGLLREGLTLALLKVVAQVSLTMFATFAPLTFVSERGLGFNPEWLAFMPLSASIFGLGIWLENRRLSALSPRRGLGLAIFALVAGFTLFWGDPNGGVVVGLLAWGLMMAGQSLFWSAHTTYWMSWLPDASRVEVQGVVGAAAALIVTVLGPLLAPELVHHPRGLYWGALLSAAALALLVWRIPGESETVRASQ